MTVHSIQRWYTAELEILPDVICGVKLFELPDIQDGAKYLHPRTSKPPEFLDLS